MFTKIISFFTSIIMAICSLLGINYQKTGRVLDAEKLEKAVTASQNARIKSGELTGSIVIAEQDGKILLSKAYGKKSVSSGEEMNMNATFRIASMTKPITAVAMLIAYDMGLLDIYADVADYLPEFSEMYVQKSDKDGNAVLDENGNIVKGEKAKNSIKVYQTVSHVSGLQEVSANFSDYESFTLADAVANIAAQPLRFEPGTQQYYCTSGFDIAARIIEIKSGMEYEEFLDKYIFSKLGMTDTTFAPSEEQFARMVGVHARNDSGEAYDAQVSENCVFGNFPVTYQAAGASLMSTASDYLKFAEMLLNNGKAPDGTQVVSEKSVQLMQTPIPEMADGIMNGSQQWGLGVRVIVNSRDTLPKGAFGWSGAYGTHFWIDPLNKTLVVYMKNSSYDGGSGAKTANELEEDVMSSFTSTKLTAE